MNVSSLWLIGKITLVFLAAYFIFGLCRASFSKELINRLIDQLRAALHKKVIARDQEQFATMQTAQYLSLLTNNIQLFRDGLLCSSFLIAQNAVSALLAIVAIFYLSPPIAILVCMCICLMVLVPYAFRKGIQKKQRHLSTSLAELTSNAKQNLQGHDVIISYQIGKHRNALFEQKNQQVTAAQTELDLQTIVSQNFSALLSVGTEMLVLFAAAFGVMHGQISAGTMVAIMQLSGAFVQPIMIIMQNIPQVIGGQVLVQQFDDILKSRDSFFSGTKRPTCHKMIECREVCFGYASGNIIFSHLNCIISRGKKIAIVGPSGAGKTTLLQLITGGISRYEGEILFDGIELKALDHSLLLSAIAVIRQDTTLFDTTVLDNITLGGTDSKLLQESCAASGVDLFIPQLSQGLDTPIQENGSNLSGGQRQRIAIARALYQKKPVLILDESTAAIDQNTALEIESRLLSIPDITLLSITHHLEEKSLSRYDEVFYVAKGCVQRGTFSQLYTFNSAFREFVGEP